MPRRRDEDLAPIVVPMKKPTPRFGVIPSRREAPKKGGDSYRRREKHRNKDDE